MNNYFVLTLGIVAGISIGTGVIHLAVGFRRRTVDLLYVTFSLFAIAYGLNIITVIGMYQANTVEAFLQAETWNGIFVSITLISLIWFVSRSTKFKPRIFLIGLTAVILFIMVLHTARPTHLYEEVIGIFFYELAWGESITILEATDTIWLTVFLIAELIALGFIIIAGIHQYRKGERSRAIILLIGMSLLIFTLAFDIVFIESGVLNFVFLSDFGFLPIAVMMAAVLATHVMQTEVELSKYQTHLQELVDERTEQLEKINVQLAVEVIERQNVERKLRQTNRRIRAMLESTPESIILMDHSGLILDLNEVAASRFSATVDEAIGRNVFDYFEGNVAERRELLWAQLLETKQPVRMEDERDGRYYANVIYPVLNGSGDVESISVFSQDVTEHLHAERNLRRRIDELDTLLQIAHSITTVETLSTTLQNVAELITDLFDARYTHFINVEGEDRSLMVLNGFDREEGLINQFPLDIPLRELTFTEQVFSSGESLIIADTTALSINPPISEFIRAHDIHHIMLVPLMVGDQVDGMMAVSRDSREHVFLSDDVKLGEIVAADIAMALENVRLQRQGEKAAAAEERTRIARDLHDAVTQTLYSAGLIAEALPRIWERDLEEGRLGLEKLRRLLHGALSEMRILLFELRPASSKLADLSTLLRHLGNALRGRSRVDVKMMFDESELVPQDVKIAFYRIAQEAMNNIEKHAEAIHVEIEMVSSESDLFLQVRDDGRGIDPQSQSEIGLGLSIMKERAEAVGAELNVQPNIGVGTEVTVRWDRNR